MLFDTENLQSWPIIQIYRASHDSQAAVTTMTSAYYYNNYTSFYYPQVGIFQINLFLEFLETTRKI